MRTGIIAFFVGILLFYQLPILPNGMTDFYWVILLVFLIVLALTKPRFRLVIFFICGSFWAFYRADLVLSHQLPQSLEAQDLVVQGTVSDLPKESSRRQQFVFDVDTLDDELLDDSDHYRFILNWYEPDSIDLNSGERWQFSIRVKRPNGFMNPGGRDYEASLFQQGINATGYVKTGEKMKTRSLTFTQKVHQWRGNIYHDLKTLFPEINNLIPALSLGIRGELTQDDWDVLISTGTIHLVAISGLHIGLIAGLAFIIGRWFWSLPIYTLHWLPAIKMGAIFAIIAAFIYAGLAGFSIPTQRALIMVTTFMICLLLNWQISRFDMLLIALFGVLVLSPASVISPGFWLSFTAVAIILYVMTGRIKVTGIWHSLLKIHFILALGLAPLLMLFFGQNPILAPLANIIAVPFFGFLITPMVLTGLLLLNIFKPVGEGLLKSADFLIDRFWPVLQWIAELPYNVLQSTILSVAILISSLLGIFILLSPRGFPGKWLGIIFFLPIFIFDPSSPDYGEYEFTLLDVGQGLSAVVKTKDHILVYDTGAKFSKDFNAGKAVVLPYLKSRGIKKLDKVIISHGDNDHIGGYQSLAEEMIIEETLTSIPEKLKEMNTQENIDLCHSDQGWEWDGVKFEILHPDEIASSTSYFIDG